MYYKLYITSNWTIDPSRLASSEPIGRSSTGLHMVILPGHLPLKNVYVEKPGIESWTFSVQTCALPTDLLWEAAFFLVRPLAKPVHNARFSLASTLQILIRYSLSLLLPLKGFFFLVWKCQELNLVPSTWKLVFHRNAVLKKAMETGLRNAAFLSGSASPCSCRFFLPTLSS